jgi:hypothetical protein
MTQTTLAAAETTRVTGTFKTLGWEETPYDEAVDMPKLVHAEVCEELEGGIEGEASISYLIAYRDDKVASFVGLTRRWADRRAVWKFGCRTRYAPAASPNRGRFFRLEHRQLAGIRGDISPRGRMVTYTLDLSF